MPNINIGLSIQVEGGPQVPVAPIKVPVEAYDKIEVSVAKDTDVSVEIQPGDTGVNFLLIKSSVYTPPDAADSEKLTYEPEGKQSINLDTPQLYLGADSIAILLGSVKTIKLSNRLAVPAGKDPSVVVSVVEILVGRDATPPSTPTSGDSQSE
jgi:hypothetical protein